METCDSVPWKKMKRPGLDKLLIKLRNMGASKRKSGAFDLMLVFRRQVIVVNTEYDANGQQ